MPVNRCTDIAIRIERAVEGIERLYIRIKITCRNIFLMEIISRTGRKMKVMSRSVCFNLNRVALIISELDIIVSDFLINGIFDVRERSGRRGAVNLFDPDIRIHPVAESNHYILIIARIGCIDPVA